MKLSNRQIIKSRNIYWLKQSYGSYKQITQVNVLHSLDEDDENDDIQSNEVFETGRIAEEK